MNWSIKLTWKILSNIKALKREVGPRNVFWQLWPPPTILGRKVPVLHKLFSDLASLNYKVVWQKHVEAVIHLRGFLRQWKNHSVNRNPCCQRRDLVLNWKMRIPNYKVLLGNQPCKRRSACVRIRDECQPNILILYILV